MNWIKKLLRLHEQSVEAEAALSQQLQRSSTVKGDIQQVTKNLQGAREAVQAKVRAVMLTPSTDLGAHDVQPAFPAAAQALSRSALKSSPG